jgi:hypothetical protein
MKPVQLLRRLRDALGVCGILAWFAWAALVMSWAGHRPITPDHEHPFPYNNHGIMYVSSDDLRASHICIGIALAFIAVTLTVHFLGLRLSPDFDDTSVKRSLQLTQTRSSALRTVVFFVLAILILVGAQFLIRAGRYGYRVEPSGGAVNGTMHVAPPYEWVIFATVVAYISTICYLMIYLKRAHPDTWVQLGSPRILVVNSMRNGFNNLRFIGFILGRKYRLLNDPQLTCIIWVIRLLFVLFFVLILAERVFHLLPPR